MTNKRVIGIGETVLDILFKNDQPQKAVPGGSTFNSIVSLGRAGVSCAMVTDVGGDHIGDIICNYLKDNGVSSEYVCRHDNVKSHITLAFLDENNDAQYVFYKDHTSVSLDSKLPNICKDDVVLFGSFFAINPVIRPVVGGLLRDARKVGAWLYYDVNFRKNHIAELPDILPNIEENMALADVVRGSMEDFGYMYDLHNGEAIYGTRPFYPYCEEKIRFTQKNGRIYAIYLLDEGEKMPNSIEIRANFDKNKIKILGSKTKVKIQKTSEGHLININGDINLEHAVVFELK